MYNKDSLSFLWVKYGLRNNARFFICAFFLGGGVFEMGNIGMRGLDLFTFFLFVVAMYQEEGTHLMFWQASCQIASDVLLSTFEKQVA